MTCAKREVVCIIRKGPHIFVGRNECDNPQLKCPRVGDDDYAKCGYICVQSDHAEGAAMKEALFRGVSLEGATAEIFGHERVCKACQTMLDLHGVIVTRIQP